MGAGRGLGGAVAKSGAYQRGTNRSGGLGLSGASIGRGDAGRRGAREAGYAEGSPRLSSRCCESVSVRVPGPWFSVLWQPAVRRPRSRRDAGVSYAHD